MHRMVLALLRSHMVLVPLLALLSLGTQYVSVVRAPLGEQDGKSRMWKHCSVDPKSLFLWTGSVTHIYFCLFRDVYFSESTSAISLKHIYGHIEWNKQTKARWKGARQPGSWRCKQITYSVLLWSPWRTRGKGKHDKTYHYFIFKDWDRK